MSDSQLSGAVGDSSSSNTTHEPTIDELKNAIRDLQRQREEDMKRWQDQFNRARVNRRSTMYVPSTPQRVSDRTSMGGMINLRPSPLASDYEYEDTDPLLEEPSMGGR